jgi:hypothetical protein
MQRFEITGDDDRLVLSMSLGYQRLGQGCLLLFLTTVCVTIIGILAVVQGDVAAGGKDLTKEAGFFDPHANHFGFLWLIATVLAGVALPLYIWKLYQTTVTFVFDRETDRFTRNGKVITRLSKVEAVRVRHSDDPDQRELHKLLVVYGDGFELPLDNWYDERETYYVAHEIAAFLGLHVLGERFPLPDSDLLPGEPGR